jgi:hypothetical protein
MSGRVGWGVIDPLFPFGTQGSLIQPKVASFFYGMLEGPGTPFIEGNNKKL